MENLQFELVYRPGSMLTTKDNPFNPLTEWEDWYRFDLNAGYNTDSYLHRLMNLDVDHTPREYYVFMDLAICHVIENDVDDIYKVVEPEVSESDVPILVSESTLLDLVI